MTLDKASAVILRCDKLETIAIDIADSYNVEGSIAEDDVSAWALEVANRIVQGLPAVVRCAECGEPSAESLEPYGMCASCQHNAIRSGWIPGVNA